VLAEDHPILRHMAVERLKDPQPFWGKLQSLPEIKSMPPASAMKGLRKSLPVRDLKMRLSHRIAGLGSLGRQRYLALADFEGGLIARETKQLTDSAWAVGVASAEEVPQAADSLSGIMDRSIRCQDPFVRLREEWIVRRLAPDCSRIELASLPATHDGVRLLRAMGWETANVHLGTCDAATLLADLKTRDGEWLNNATKVMVESVQKDWKAWKSRSPRRFPRKAFTPDPAAYAIRRGVPRTWSGNPTPPGRALGVYVPSACMWRAPT